MGSWYNSIAYSILTNVQYPIYSYTLFPKNNQIHHLSRRRCIIYATGCPRPLYVWLSTREGLHDNPPLWSVDLDLSSWFPSSSVRETPHTIPGSTVLLHHKYDIFYSRDNVTSLPNECLATRFNCHWMGNIVVVKRG